MFAADFQTTEQVLEMLLMKEEEHPILDVILDVTGYRWMSQKVNKARAARQKWDFVHRFPVIKAMVESEKWEEFMAFAMFTNSLMIGFQVSSPAQAVSESDIAAAGVYRVLDHVYTVIFVFELIFRNLADGWTWWWNTSNIFDVLVITGTNVIPLWVLVPLNVDNSIVRPFAVLRMIRLLKLAKLIRKYKFFRILFNLISGIINCGRTLTFTLVIMTVTIYVMAVMCVTAIGDDPKLQDNEMAMELFKRVPEAFFTLFQVMTLDSWSGITRPLGPINPWVTILLILHIATIELCLCNLVTAVIVNDAFERAQNDEELVAEERKERTEAEMHELAELFMELDEDASGKISYEEYTYAVRDSEAVQMKLKLLEVDDPEELWSLIDLGDGEIAIDQFTQTIRALQGDALSKDSFSILQRISYGDERVRDLTTKMASNKLEADKLIVEVQQVHRALGRAMKEMQDFMVYTNKCIPQPQVSIDTKKIVNYFAENQRKMVYGENLKAKADKVKQVKKEEALGLRAGLMAKMKRESQAAQTGEVAAALALMNSTSRSNVLDGPDLT